VTRTTAANRETHALELRHARAGARDAGVREPALTEHGAQSDHAASNAVNVPLAGALPMDVRWPNRAGPGLRER
jgi:hypothetical protein